MGIWKPTMVLPLSNTLTSKLDLLAQLSQEMLLQINLLHLQRLAQLLHMDQIQELPPPMVVEELALEDLLTFVSLSVPMSRRKFIKSVFNSALLIALKM